MLAGLVAYFVVSQEDDSESPIFRFHDNKEMDRLDRFGIFKDAMSGGQGIHPSFVVKLNPDLLESSVEKNAGMPSGRRMQKYNYGVTDTGVIVVAVWTIQNRWY